MAASVITNKDYTIIPGRLRIAIRGLRNNRSLACQLIIRLSEEKGIRSITANPLTGRALIYFNPRLLNLPQIEQLIDRAIQLRLTSDSTSLWHPIHEQNASANMLPLLYPLAAGAVISALIIKRLLLGKSPLSSSPYLISLAALATIIGGYPVLQSGFHKIAEKKKLNAELLLFSLTLILLTMRESIAGLSVLWLVYMTNLSGHTLQQQTKQHLNRLLPCKTAFPVSAAAQSRPLTGRPSPIHYKARLLLAVSIAGIVYLTTRDAMRSLAVLVAGCPVTAALSRSSALDAAMLAAAKQRIFIKEAQAIKFAEQLSPQSFAVPSPLADELVIALGQDSVKKAGYAAHVVICDNDPRKLDELIRLSQQTNEIIRQNAILTTWFNGTGMLLATLRLLSPVGAGLLLNACTVTVILNSRRLSPTNSTLELKSRADNHSTK